MSRIVIGAYAHVDGGKTTLSEAILHKCGVLNKSGRVDHEDSFLDYNGFERQKGITVLAKQARFSYKDKDYIYVDTPGHLDFIGEVNRSFEILDAAILIIDASSPIPADTIRRFKHLKTLNIPICIFLNKMDIAHQSKDELLNSLQKQLDPDIVLQEEVKETVALNHEEILDTYLSQNTIDDSYIINDFKQGLFFPLFAGSALHEEGIDELLDFINSYVEVHESSGSFKAYIYKIDEYAHLKIFSGTLKNRDVFGDFKISEIVQFNGQKARQVNEVKGSDLCSVKGLQGLKAGTYLPSLFCQEDMELNTLTYRINSKLDANQLYRTIEPLNSEFPELNITLDKDVSIDLLGNLHQDFIRNLIKERYGLDISFSKPLIQYRESIEEEVYGVGHYEPLRHYAEVLVRLRPDQTYKVKGKKEFSVLLDYLHTYRPCGLLTDSPLDQLEIEIIDIKTHLKHTEGGDLLQALNRAIRQALFKAKGVVLEPYYLVSLNGDKKTINGIITDLSSHQYVFDIEGDMLMGKIDKASFNEFMIYLSSRYKDDFSYSIETEVYDRCRNEKEVIQQIGYDYASDASKPIGSIFTRNGAGTYISPEEVEENMHLNLRDYFADYQEPVKHKPRNVGEEELKRVWNSLYKPRPRYIERNKETQDNKKTSFKQAKELMYLLDGYNIMHAMEDVPLNDLTMAREKVIDLVCDFAGYVAASCVLVFDAYLQDSYKVNVSERDNITIVYTKTRQTADMYIEAKAKELKDTYRLIVVTSDALEQLSIFSSDAFRLSSREFLARYHNMQKNMTHIEKVSNRPLQQLRDLLDQE
ncbi:MAG: NYN domain-containing protein [Erysipelotrichaceae bacterium]|nr:NYN domain-containing protein [Erysipelotrichaceae bacterium]